MNQTLAHDWFRSATRAHWKSARVRVWAMVLATTGAVLSFIPLFHVLGFEFSFALSLIASLCALDLGCAWVRRLRDTPCEPLARFASAPKTLAHIVLRGSLVNLCLLALPVFIISINAVRVRNCDWWFGVSAVMLMPLLSTLMATALGVLCGLATAAHRRLSLALPYVIFLAAVAYAVWGFYNAPPVFSYNMFAGYFPGNLYDEQIAFHAPFFWSRLYQLSALLCALGLAAICLDVPSLGLRPPFHARPRRRLWIPAGIALSSGALAVWLGCLSGELGFSIETADIKRHLGGRIETPHFVIHYPRGGDIERDIGFIAEDHEFRYHQVTRTLGIEVPGKITSFYFANTEQKFEQIGARNVYMAKPWRKEIYLHHQTFPHQILRHEIAHVVAGEFGDSLFHISITDRWGLPVAVNIGLVEGIAVAADWPDHFTRALTPHQSVKALLELDMAPPVGQIFSTGFLSFSSARSYTVAGSFVRFLLDTYGADRLRVMYRNGGDAVAAYGKTQARLGDEWMQHIRDTELPPEAAEVVRERFRRRSIFRRPCPHAIARRLDDAARLAAQGQVDQAISKLQQVCSDAPSEPRYQMQLARLLHASGYPRRAAELLSRIADDAELSSSVRASALLDLIALSMSGFQPGSAARVGEYLERAAALPLDDNLQRSVQAQRFAGYHTGPAGPLLRAYFWDQNILTGFDPVVGAARAARAIAAEPGLGIGYYLLGRNLRGRGAPGEAAEVLEQALALGLPHPLLTKACMELLVESAYLSGDYDRATAAAQRLSSPGQSAVTRLLGDDWLQRIAWKRNRTKAPTSR